MDHPNAPTTVTLSDGKLGCSHPKCTGRSFRTESGIGLHFSTVHTVPYGDGLTAKCMESRIVDWDPVAMKKLDEALAAANARVEQIKIIASAGRKCDVGVNRPTTVSRSPPKRQQLRKQQWNTHDNRSNRSHQQRNRRPTAAIPRLSEKTHFNSAASAFNPAAPVFEPKAKAKNIPLSPIGSSFMQITGSGIPDRHRQHHIGQAISRIPNFKKQFEAARDEFAHKHERPPTPQPTPPLSQATDPATVGIPVSTPRAFVENTNQKVTGKKTSATVTQGTVTAPIAASVTAPAANTIVSEVRVTPAGNAPAEKASFEKTLVADTSFSVSSPEKTSTINKNKASFRKGSTRNTSLEGTLIDNKNISLENTITGKSGCDYYSKYRFNNNFMSYKANSTHTHIGSPNGASPLPQASNVIGISSTSEAAAGHPNDILPKSVRHKKKKNMTAFNIRRTPPNLVSTQEWEDPLPTRSESAIPRARTIIENKKEVIGMNSREFRSKSSNFTVGTPEWAVVLPSHLQPITSPKQESIGSKEKETGMPLAPIQAYYTSPNLAVDTPDWSSLAQNAQTPKTPNPAKQKNEMEVGKVIHSSNLLSSPASCVTYSSPSTPTTLVSSSTNGRDDDDEKTIINTEDEMNEECLDPSERLSCYSNLELLSIKYGRPTPAFPLRLISEIRAGKYGVEFGKKGTNLDRETLPHKTHLAVAVEKTPERFSNSLASKKRFEKRPSSSPQEVIMDKNQPLSSITSPLTANVVGPAISLDNNPAGNRITSSPISTKANLAISASSSSKGKKPLTEAQLEKRREKFRKQKERNRQQKMEELFSSPSQVQTEQTSSSPHRLRGQPPSPSSRHWKSNQYRHSQNHMARERGYVSFDR